MKTPKIVTLVPKASVKKASVAPPPRNPIKNLGDYAHPPKGKKR
jgi:hypothetical protein